MQPENIYSKTGLAGLSASVMIIGIIIAGAGVTYVMFEDVLGAQEKTSIPLDTMRIESCFYQPPNVTLAVRNQDEETVSGSGITVEFEGVPVQDKRFTEPPETIEPGQTFTVSINASGITGTIPRNSTVRLGNLRGKTKTHSCTKLWERKTFEVNLNEGTFSGTEVGGGALRLGKDQRNENWLETTPAIATGVALDSDENVYSSLQNGNLLKMDSSGNKLWSRDLTGSRLKDVETDSSDYIYTGGRDDKVRKVDPSQNQFWVSSVFKDTVTDLDVGPSGNIYGVSRDDTVRKLDSSDGTQIWKFDTGENLQSVSVAENGMVFAGSNFHIYKLDNDGNKLDERSTTGKVNSISTHPGPYRYFQAAINDPANNEFLVKKIRFSGSTMWTYSGHTDSVGEVEVLESNESFTASRLAGDRLIKLTENGNKAWEEETNDSNTGLEYRDGRLYQSGSNTVEPGQVARYGGFRSSGSWTSENIAPGEEKVKWEEMEVESALNGQSASVTIELSNDPSFSSPVYSDTRSLSGGTETVGINEEAKYARLEVQENGDTKETPETESIELQYLKAR